jgi:2,3-dihydroxybenzoate decarboxylase
MKKRIVAVEEHWGTKELTEIASNSWNARKDAKWRDPNVFSGSIPRLWDFEKWRLPTMDDYGITVQVLSISHAIFQQLADPAVALPLVRKINELQAEMIERYPDRFAGFASLPTAVSPKAAADELERAVTELGFKGAIIQGHTNGEYLDEPKYWVIWERAAGLGVPVYLHPNEPSPDSIKMYGGHTELMGPTWGWVVETATHALRIIMSGVFDAFPKAMLILGHLGEALPYLLGRLDEGYAMSAKSVTLKKLPSEYVKENILVTTSGLYKREALTCAINALGADRILFAVDYPFADTKASIEAFDRAPMSDSDKEKIYHLNAERWLGL